MFIIAFTTANHRTSSGPNESTAESIGSGWTDFHEIWCLVIFLNSFEKIQDILKSDKINGYFTWRPMYVYDNIPKTFIFVW